jgi:hypothetical protein
MGIVSKPPFLRGAHPAAAVTIAFFEFTFYWCAIVLVSHLAHHERRRFTARGGSAPERAQDRIDG